MYLPFPPTQQTRKKVVNMKDDRRKYKRYTLKDGTFVSISSCFLVGQVKDISKGGVSFTCLATESKIGDNSSVDLFSREKGLYMREIPFSIVSETYVLNQNPCSSLHMKRIAGAFGKMSEHQESELDMFLKSCTAAEA